VKFSYYPGCSLSGTGKEFDISTRLVCGYLNIVLEELPGWNCCGASSAHSLNHNVSVALCARNLKIADTLKFDLVVPCAACFNRLKQADYLLKNDPKMRERMVKLFNYEYSNGIKIFHIIELFDKSAEVKNLIKKHLKRPFNNLTLACYYGCLLVRPPNIMNFDDPDNPTVLDRLMSLLGAATVFWPYKTECCGASLSLTRDDIVNELVHKIIIGAKDAGAHAIVVACPLCALNLEMRQKENFPIFYFTELIGIALGIEKCRDLLKKHLSPGYKLLKTLRL